MDLRDYLTNDELRKKFKSQFDLVNHAIKLAENMIKTGRDSRVKLDVQNRSMHILAEIANGKDQFDEVPEKVARVNHEESFVEERQRIQENERKKTMSGPFTKTSANPKKGRKILSEQSSK